MKKYQVNYIIKYKYKVHYVTMQCIKSYRPRSIHTKKFDCVEPEPQRIQMEDSAQYWYGVTKKVLSDVAGWFTKKNNPKN